jgi:hypothetical protein
LKLDKKKVVEIFETIAGIFKNFSIFFLNSLGIFLLKVRIKISPHLVFGPSDTPSSPGERRIPIFLAELFSPRSIYPESENKVKKSSLGFLEVPPLTHFFFAF